MKTFKRNILFFGIMLVPFLFVSCADDDSDVTQPDETIVDIAIGNENFSTLVAALQEAGLVDDLSGTGPFTVFAPTDAAFTAAGISLDDPNLADILLYHVVAGSVSSDQLVDGPVATLNGQSVTVDVANLALIDETGNSVSINASFLDIEGSNGIIHGIDEVLLPSTENIVEIAQGNSNFSTLVAALTEADLVSTLEGAGPFTVFAPTNQAFSDAGVSLSNPDLASILTYHVVPGRILSAGLSNGPVTTVQGETITIDATNLTLTDSRGNIIDIGSPIDVEGTNGVIHTIDGVLMPGLMQSNVITTAQATASLSMLVDALTRFPDLVSDLSDEDGKFTVFAPNDDAFADLLAAVGQNELDDIPNDVIRNILEYHVIAGAEAFSGSLMNNQTVTALNNEDITVTITDGDVSVNGNLVSTPDVNVSNGVVHIIDGVLIPELEASIVNTIVEPAYFNVNFSTLTAAVVQAGLLETLTDPEINWTLFAPDNDAFAAAGINELPADTEEGNMALAGILQYHVIGMAGGGQLFASDLPSTEGGFAAPVTTLNGDFFLTNNTNGVFINGNSEVVVATEAEGALDYDNGVVHLINRTLTPAEFDVVGIAGNAGFTSLAAALDEANLVMTLQTEGPFTVFAPTNQAFDDLYTALGAEVNGPEDVDDATLEAVLLYHVLGARVFSSDLSDGLEATTLSGDPAATFTVNVGMDGVTITDNNDDSEDAEVSGTDNLGTNGVVHIIESVLLPVNL